MATSPSDLHNKNIIAWLDRLQTSLRDGGGGGNGGGAPAKSLGFPPSFSGMGTNMDTVGSDEDGNVRGSGGKGALTHAQRYGLSAVPSDEDEATSSEGKDGEGDGNTSLDGDAEDGDDNNRNSSLPESHVPLGLIASLSLGNHDQSSRGGGGNSKVAKMNAAQANDAAAMGEEHGGDDDDVVRGPLCLYELFHPFSPSLAPFFFPFPPLSFLSHSILNVLFSRG